MDAPLTRRELLASAAALGAVAIEPVVIQAHDKAVENYLKNQVTDLASRWRGALPDAFGIHNPGSAAGCLEAFTAAFLQPGSKFHKSALLVERMRLAIDHLERLQTPQGNFNLLITNFNSPPDTGFIVRAAASAANLARRHGEHELFNRVAPVLRKAGGGLVAGGVHTPNHRWVMCAALAQLNELFPDPAYVRRIDQWLAEGFDIDADGQYSERSTVVYNGITNSALVVMADKLKRGELLDPVRRNLDALLYLLHPGLEVVTDISRRQDQYQRGKPQSSWFALRYLAYKNGNGRYATLADQLSPSLSALMEYPELAGAGPRREALPEDYERIFPSGEYARIRRGAISATILLGGYSRFFGLRRGEAVINAVRFAGAFFGRGQFVPAKGEKRGSTYFLEQPLDAGYYQPFDPPRRVGAAHAEWTSARPQRQRTEVCEMRYTAAVRETAKGFELRIQAQGTRDVPVAVEINLREGGKLEGCVPAPEVADAWILAEGMATHRAGGDMIRFGPGLRQHSYTQVRGAEPKLPGPSVYLCGYTPFERMLTFEVG